jgi:hypothetical protein
MNEPNSEETRRRVMGHRRRGGLFGSFIMIHHPTAIVASIKSQPETHAFTVG